MAVPETLEIYSQFKPDVIIMDYKLIGGNPMDVLEALKLETVHPLVIVLTDNFYPQIAKQYIQGGAGYVFDKSTELEKIPKVLMNYSQTSLVAVKTQRGKMKDSN